MADNKALASELADLMTLAEKIRLYTATGKKGGRQAKNPGAVKAGDKMLLRVLKTKYSLNESERAQILSIVAGKQVRKTKTGVVRVLNDHEKGEVKKEIDSLISKIGISIRAQNLSDRDYYRRVAGNVSIRKNKILGQMGNNRPKRRRKAAK
ncbi:MAG: hypothetical protein LBU73_03385 [Helicobacteraceae bacterium]|jgi:hypothetical protein|nr:hypothetical protein [Helicobacteraceae bacterium]